VTRNSIRLAGIGCGIILALWVLACSPEVGSKAWCEKLAEKPKGDWSANEAADYAKHCLFD
jgi:hypothetical protein